MSFSFFASASPDRSSAEHFIGEDWLVLLTGHFPRVNGSFWLCSSVVGRELSPVRLNVANVCLMAKTPGTVGSIPRKLPNALRVREIKC